jgi:hypothetical protein
MSSFAIAIELGDKIPANAPLTAEAFPNLAASVQRMVELAHQEWTEYALGKPLPGGLVINNRTGEYARSISMREIGPFAGEVYTVLPYAQAIEEGSPARDMKKMLDSSLKVRLSKTGKRYLIIPFRHDRFNTPKAVLDWWVKQSPRPATSHVTGTYRRVSGTGAYDIGTRKLITVPGWRYAWGDRLGKSHLDTLGVGERDAKRLAGMVRFANPGGKMGGGAPKGSHSSLITFRVMVEGSKGWISPAQPGKHPARTVADQLRPIAEREFQTAVEADVRDLLGGT